MLPSQAEDSPVHTINESFYYHVHCQEIRRTKQYERIFYSALFHMVMNRRMDLPGNSEIEWRTPTKQSRQSRLKALFHMTIHTNAEEGYEEDEETRT